MDNKKFSKKLSLRVDALNQRIDDLKCLPDNETKRKSIAVATKRLRRVEKRIPQ